MATRADPQPKPCVPSQSRDAVQLRRQLRRRSAARLMQTLSLDAADGLAGDAAASFSPAGRHRSASSPYAWVALAAGGGRAASGGGLRAEVLRAALRRSSAPTPHLAGGCGCAAGGRGIA
jgi:hypothetical protein